jgi:hypothetical protein
METNETRKYSKIFLKEKRKNILMREMLWHLVSPYQLKHLKFG